MDKCPICRYPLDQCQCLHDYQYPFYAGSSHPDRSKRQRVVLDHLYILSEPQLRHVIELERRSNISYADPELTEIWDKLNAQFFNSKKNAENAKRIIEVDGSKSSEATVCDMQELKHGKWEEIRDAYGQLEGWIHIECGREVKIKENYCPCCGARMINPHPDELSEKITVG